MLLAPAGEASGLLRTYGTMKLTDWERSRLDCSRRRPADGPATVAQTACSKTSCLPREGTRPTRFPRRSTCIVGPVPSPGGFFNGFLTHSTTLQRQKMVAAQAAKSNEAKPAFHCIFNLSQLSGSYRAEFSQQHRSRNIAQTLRVERSGFKSGHSDGHFESCAPNGRRVGHNLENSTFIIVEPPLRTDSVSRRRSRSRLSSRHASRIFPSAWPGMVMKLHSCFHE